jgi:hypothetical protein
MPRRDKSSYTSKPERQAEQIEKGYRGRGIGIIEAERRAWALVNKETVGGRKGAAKKKRSTSTSRSTTTAKRGRKGTSRRRTVSSRSSSRQK